MLVWVLREIVSLHHLTHIKCSTPPTTPTSTFKGQTIAAALTVVMHHAHIMSLQCTASQDGGGDGSGHRESSGRVNEETCLDELAREVGMEWLVVEPDVGEESSENYTCMYMTLNIK